MSVIALRLKDSVYTTGIIFIVVSLILFCIPLSPAFPADDSLGIFVFNFLLAGIYFFVLLISGKLKRGRKGIHTFFLFLILFLLSAYSLNRQMSIFEDSTTWLCVVLIAACANYIAFSFFHFFPVWLKHTTCFLLGVSVLIFIYLSLYLVPYYAVGIAGFFVLGISLHIFAPLLFTIYSFVLIKRTAALYKTVWYSFIAGIGTVILFVIAFMLQWSSITNEINRQYRNEIATADKTLPAWVRVSQKIEKNWISEKVLKTHLVYSVPSGDGQLFRMPNRNFGDEHKHDPLVILSSFFTKKVNLSDDEKINVLKSLYDSRHEAEERLWSGKNLVTEHVNTHVQVWPQFRLAYTEKIITVSNNNRNAWQSQEEAIYTFYLPEGGVVTSLSLWINGIEEKAILTSKAKASNAYKTIVGVESRDPSIVQWQEGNRVSVRVFPVLPGKSRMFKVGITSPVSVDQGELSYNNFYFDGPSVTNAEEDVKVNFTSNAQVKVPSSFNAHSNSTFTKSGGYDPAWKVSWNEQAVEKGEFAFDGNVYSIQPYVHNRKTADLQNVYLDINASWTENEFENVFELVKERQVFVYTDKMQLLNQNNKDDLYTQLSAQRFSLFPFHQIVSPDRCLVITKNGKLSPNIDDLSQSEFLRHLDDVSSQQVKYRLFNLGDELSSYLQSLKEMRWFDYENGNISALKEIISSNSFAADYEDSSTVIIHNAGIVLTRTRGDVNASSAPDHLMRLFAYNHIMQQLGKDILSKDADREDLLLQAERAYIVTPLSSLVVLESQKDYDRFNIKDNVNSLKNASSKSTGAVPEPHEWALIILVIIILLYAKFPFLFYRLTRRA